jgi:hypothetical protein
MMAKKRFVKVVEYEDSGEAGPWIAGSLLLVLCGMYVLFRHDDLVVMIAAIIWVFGYPLIDYLTHLKIYWEEE